jgi:predicted transcriptional regulator
MELILEPSVKPKSIRDITHISPHQFEGQISLKSYPRSVTRKRNFDALHKSSNLIELNKKQSRTNIKQHYRTSLEILAEILQIIMDGGIEGVKISEISLKARLSYDSAVDNCKKLANAILIEPERRGRNYIFKINAKGMDFFREFKIFQDMVHHLNLSL